ncbi:MAG: hypothetical protein K5678_05840 [Acetatifactor sp.]|nr:hypothetical protein [Acetatifactor sp.]
MNKKKPLTWTIMALFCALFIFPFHVMAAENSSEKWRDTRDYPLQYGDEELIAMPFEKQLELLNPPKELLEEFTTEELADLILRHPLLSEMLGIFDFDMPAFFERLENYSSIFSELEDRDGANKAVLETMNDRVLDVDQINAFEGIAGAFQVSESVRAEVFVRNYVMVFWDRFSSEDRALYQIILEQRTGKYYARINNENVRRFFTEVPLNDTEPADQFMAAYKLRQRWYEKIEYPIAPDDPTWAMRSFDELNRILTPPENVLKSLTIEELTGLVLNYPFLREYEFHDTTRQYFNIFLERTCAVFRELLEREGGIECLLSAYEANELNIDALNVNGLNAEDSSVVREVFLCKFIDYYSTLRFHEEDIAQYERIYREKQKTYEEIKDECVREAFETRLSKRMKKDMTEGVPDSNAAVNNTEQLSDLSSSDVPVSETEKDDQDFNRDHNWIVWGIILATLIALSVVIVIAARRGKIRK